MRRLILTIAAVAAVAGPIAAVATTASAQDRDWRGDDRSDRDGRWDRDRDGDRDRDRGDWNRDRDGRWDRDDRRDDRRGDNRWDRNRHNGYYYNNRWSYGAPPANYYGRPGYRPGYNAWRRGAYLPQSYRGNGYWVNDYNRYRLRPPPRGYRWHRVNNDYLLVAIATGLIFDVIINSGY